MKKVIALLLAIVIVPVILLAQMPAKSISQPQNNKVKAEEDSQTLVTTPTQTIICPVIKDTWVYAFRPDSNYGKGRDWKEKTDREKDLAVPKMFLGFGGADKKVILAQFDVSKLPKGKIPLKAVVKFYNDYAGSAVETKVDLKLVAMPWEELKVKWKNKPKWTTVSISSLVLTGAVGYNQAGKWYEWEAAKLIDLWVIKNKPNYGIALDPQGDSGVDRDFICKEYKGKEQFFPVLEVTYNKDQPEPKITP